VHAPAAGLPIGEVRDREVVAAPPAALASTPPPNAETRRLPALSSARTAHERAVEEVRAALFGAAAPETGLPAGPALTPAAVPIGLTTVDSAAAAAVTAVAPAVHAIGKVKNRRGSNNPQARIRGPLVAVLVHQEETGWWRWTLPSTGESDLEKYEYAARRAGHAAAVNLTVDRINQLCPDGLTAPEAAAVFAVDANTIPASWAQSRKGKPPHLTRLPGPPGRQPRYALSDLRRVEELTRRNLPAPQKSPKRKRR
jgi:hypothetical protein